MKTTLSIIKADIGSLGGHIKPSTELFKEVEQYIKKGGTGVIKDFFVSHTGDDMAILFSHTNGVGNDKVHKLAGMHFWQGLLWQKGRGFMAQARTSKRLLFRQCEGYGSC
jgi:fructose 1,6-bisphosphate aldolase/phosphatase